MLRGINSEVRREIAIHKSSCWQSFLSTIREKSDQPEKTFWSHLSHVYKFNSLPFSKLDDGQSVLSDKKEIVDTLFSYYKNQFSKTVIKTDDPNDMGIEEEYGILLKELSSSEETIAVTSAFEITKFIKKLKPKKSSGFDQISNFMIKLLPSSYITCLVNCSNVWLKESRYLEQ